MKGIPCAEPHRCMELVLSEGTEYASPRNREGPSSISYVSLSIFASNWWTLEHERSKRRTAVLGECCPTDTESMGGRASGVLGHGREAKGGSQDEHGA